MGHPCVEVAHRIGVWLTTQTDIERRQAAIAVFASGSTGRVFGCARRGGESGIRTLGRVSPTHAFQACSFNHSDISPFKWVNSLQRVGNTSKPTYAAAKGNAPTAFAAAPNDSRMSPGVAAGATFTVFLPVARGSEGV